MTSAPRNRAALADWALAYAVVLASRLALIVLPPSGHLYNTDELQMTFASLDCFLGLPATSLAWPGSVLQLLTTPLFGLRLLGGCLHAGREARNLSCVATGLGELYLHPWGALATMRTISALIASATPLLAAVAVRRVGGSRPAAMVTGVTVATVGLLWQHGAMATGDAVSVTFALGAIVAALPSGERPGRPLLAGALVGAALASKVTALFVCLGSGALLLADPQVRGWLRLRVGALWAGGAAIAFIGLCPYVWVEPLRMAKATLGNFSRAGTSHGLAGLWSATSDAAGPTVWILLAGAAIGLAELIRGPRRWIGWVLVGTLALVAWPMTHAGVLFPRYALPLITTLSIPMGAGFSAVLGRLAERWRPAGIAVLILPAALALATDVANEAQARGPKPNLRALEAALAAPTGDVYLPAGLQPVAMPAISRADASRMRESAARAVADASSTISFVSSNGIDPKAARALMTDFNEDEQAVFGRLAAMETVAPASARSIHFYVPQEDAGGAPRIAYYEGFQRAAIQDYERNTGPAVFVAGTPISVPADEVKGFGPDWHVYFKASHQADAGRSGR